MQTQKNKDHSKDVVSTRKPQFPSSLHFLLCYADQWGMGYGVSFEEARQTESCCCLDVVKKRGKNKRHRPVSFLTGLTFRVAPSHRQCCLLLP